MMERNMAHSRRHTPGAWWYIAALWAVGCSTSEDGASPCVAGQTWDHDGDGSTACVAVTVCADDEREVSAPTADADRVCESDGETAGTPEPNEPNPSMPETPEPTVVVCVEGETWDHDGDPATDCEAVSGACAAGSVETAAPTTTTDRACETCEAGEYCAGGEAASAECGAGTTWDDDADPATECVATTECSQQQYVETAADATRDRSCGECPKNWRATSVNASTCDEWVAPTYAALSAASYRTCALTSGDGAIECWGTDEHGHTSTVPIQTGFVDIATGNRHACALDDSGAATCWGDDGNGQLGTPMGVAFDAISAGGNHTCGIRTDTKAVECWGLDDQGQASGAPSGVAMSEVSAGLQHTCAVRADNGELECWGYDLYGQVDDAPAGAWRSVSAGYNHSCAVNVATGLPSCWGANNLGQTNAPDTHQLAVVVAGDHHSCGVRADNGEPVCWGNDSRRQRSGAPEASMGALAAGRHHTCGLLDNGEARCWGEDTVAQSSGAPSADAFASLHASPVGSCGIRDASGELVCFGDNTFNQLSEVPPGAFSDAGFGTWHVCALAASDGYAQCWGSNGNGEVDDAPDDVAFDRIASGNGFSCAVRSDDATLMCWGIDEDDEVSDAPTAPVRDVVLANSMGCAIVDANQYLSCWGEASGTLLEDIATDLAVSAVAIGDDHVCALRAGDDGIECWGADDEGQVADAPAGAHTSITAGDGFTCALRPDLSPVCWGDDGYGLVTGAPAHERFRSLHAESGTVCGLREMTGQRVCWGQALANP